MDIMLKTKYNIGQLVLAWNDSMSMIGIVTGFTVDVYSSQGTIRYHIKDRNSTKDFPEHNIFPDMGTLEDFINKSI